MLAECGNAQPRTLAGAFARGVTGDDLMAVSIDELGRFRTALDDAYGAGERAERRMRVGEAGTLAEIVAFCREAATCQPS
jgi:CRISPR system Cascade subunit CasC